MASYTYTSKDYSKDYEALKEQQKKALTAQYAAQEQELLAQKPQIKAQYDEKRRDATVQARQQAQAQSEILAALGLGGSNAAAPQSGYEEAQRSAQNTALRTALGGLTLSQSQEQAAVNDSVRALQQQRDFAIADALMQLDAQQLSAVQQEEQFAAQQQATLRQAALSRAYQELAAFGKVISKESAEALGVPVGTRLSAFK